LPFFIRLSCASIDRDIIGSARQAGSFLPISVAILTTDFRGINRP
jgi:hypothetical protein